MSALESVRPSENCRSYKRSVESAPPARLNKVKYKVRLEELEETPKLLLLLLVREMKAERALNF